MPTGHVWNSIRHEPLEEMIARQICQSVRHGDNYPPPAEWLELIWLPRAPLLEARVYSAWFTCRECHKMMRETTDNVH